MHFSALHPLNKGHHGTLTASCVEVEEVGTSLLAACVSRTWRIDVAAHFKVLSDTAVMTLDFCAAG